MAESGQGTDAFVVLVEFQTSAEEQDMLASLAADRAEAVMAKRSGFLWTRIWRDEDGTGFWWMTGWKDRESYMASIQDPEAQTMMRQAIRENLRPRTTFLHVHKSIGTA